MLWFWIILGCVIVVLLVVLEIRAEKKPGKLRSGFGGVLLPFTNDATTRLNKSSNSPDDRADDKLN